MALQDGRTTAKPYVQDIVDNLNNRILPLLTVGDEVPLLQGQFGQFSANATEKFAFSIFSLIKPILNIAFS